MGEGDNVPPGLVPTRANPPTTEAPTATVVEAPGRPHLPPMSGASDPVKQRHWSGRWVAFCWLVLFGASATAARQLPAYIDSLDARILYANPDCMAVVADSMGAVGLTVEERQDPVMPWTRACQDQRQVRMLEHANRVGYGTTGILLLFSVVTVALTFSWGWERIRERME